MGIYGGKTYGDNSFVFDAVYSNYKEMAKDIHNIFVNRYVFVMYCDTAFNIKARQRIENTTNVNDLTGDEKVYYQNYAEDNKVSHDRIVYQAIWDADQQKVIPREVVNLNNNLTDEYASFLLHWLRDNVEGDQVSYYQCTKEELDSTEKQPGRIYAVIDAGALFLDLDANTRIELSASLKEVGSLLTTVHCVNAPSPVYYLSGSLKEEVWVYNGEDLPSDYEYPGFIVDIYSLLYCLITGTEGEIPENVKEVKFNSSLLPDRDYYMNLRGNGVIFTNFTIGGRSLQSFRIENIYFKNDNNLSFLVEPTNMSFKNCAFISNDTNPLLRSTFEPIVEITAKFENCLFSSPKEKKVYAGYAMTPTFTNCVTLGQATLGTETTPDGSYEKLPALNRTTAPKLSWGVDWFDKLETSLLDYIKSAKKPEVVYTQNEPIDKDVIWVPVDEAEADYIIEKQQFTNYAGVQWVIQKYKSGLVKCYGRDQVGTTISPSSSNGCFRILADDSGNQAVHLPGVFSDVLKRDVYIYDISVNNGGRDPADVVWSFQKCAIADNNYFPYGYIYYNGDTTDKLYTIFMGYEVIGFVS